MRTVLSQLRRAVDDYGLISEGDVIAVGVSGGKDSLVLLAGLAALRKFYPKKFDIIGITLDMGFPGADYSPISEYCREHGIDYRIIKTEIGKIIFDVRKESNPCSLCSRMRRGALNEEAVRLGANKVALGHNFDDAVETFMLNLFFEGRIGCFSPKSYLDRREITVIRPIIYMPERDCSSAAKRLALPVCSSLCPANEHTERENMKTLLRELEKDNKGLRERIFGAMVRKNIDGFGAFEREDAEK